MNKLLLRFEWYRMKHLDSYIPEKYKKAYENMQRGIPVSFEEAHKVCEIVENVKRGGNMNKELEEAIKRLNNFSKIKIMYGNTYVIHLENLNLKEIKQAIETVLNYIDNSISKEVIKEKIEEEKITQKDIQEHNYDENRMKTVNERIFVLQELLKEKYE